MQYTSKHGSQHCDVGQGLGGDAEGVRLELIRVQGVVRGEQLRDPDLPVESREESELVRPEDQVWGGEEAAGDGLSKSRIKQMKIVKERKNSKEAGADPRSALTFLSMQVSGSTRGCE